MSESNLFRHVINIAIQVVVSTGTITYIAYEHPHVINVTPAEHRDHDAERFKQINKRLDRLEKKNNITNETAF